MEKCENKKRKSNIELLRIVSILMIISFHYAFKSGYTVNSLNYNTIVVKSFYFLGELGVNLFVLITGYFMVNGKFSSKKLIKLILEVNFYYIFTFILSYFFEHKSFETLKSFKNTFLIFFGVIFSRYWFATAYILLYMISPYLNIIINNLKQDDYKKMLILFLILWSVIPTIFGVFSDPENLLFYNRLIWFVVLYFIGAYIRLYQIKIFDKMSKSVLITVITALIMFASIFAFYKIKTTFRTFADIEISYFWPPNTIFMIILSIAIFEIFLKIKLEYNKFINLIASTTLGIYMLHDGPLRVYIISILFKANEKLNGSHPITSIFISTIIIFAVGIIIDLIRQFIEKFTVNKFLESKCFEKIKKCSNNAINNISKII